VKLYEAGERLVRVVEENFAVRVVVVEKALAQLEEEAIVSGEAIAKAELAAGPILSILLFASGLMNMSKHLR